MVTLSAVTQHSLHEPATHTYFCVLKVKVCPSLPASESLLYITIAPPRDRIRAARRGQEGAGLAAAMQYLQSEFMLPGVL